MNWSDKANCKATDEKFVPDHTDPTQMQGLARRFCQDCPVLQACGQHADQAKEFGLWGGVFRHRSGETGRYQFHVLVKGAPEPTLKGRRPGVRAGWAA